MTYILNSSAADLTWSKSSFSGNQGDCVEVAAGQLPGAVPVRDSKVPTGPALILPDSTWSAFVAGVKGGGIV